jgi:phosphoribosyl 1,2-cyclic phosphate phosphodiesterase
VVRHYFLYIFETPPGSLYPPLLDVGRIEAGRILSIEGAGGAVEILPFRL